MWNCVYACRIALETSSYTHSCRREKDFAERRLSCYFSIYIRPIHLLLWSSYDVGLGFIFLLPPVMVTLTKRRVYVMRFFARPLGVFFFSCGST